MFFRSGRRPGGTTKHAKRRAMLLALTLFALTLAAALIAPLAQWSGLAALRAHDELVDIQHDLAVESVVALLPVLLSEQRGITESLDRDNAANIEFQLGQASVRVLLQDESAKFPLRLVAMQSDGQPNPDPINQLQMAFALPGLPRRASKSAFEDQRLGVRIGSIEDVFEECGDPALYGDPDQQRVWSRYLTAHAVRIHARRAVVPVLEAALADLEPGLGTRIAQRLQSNGNRRQLEEVIAELGLDAKRAEEVQGRLTSEPLTYSALIRTTIHARSRQSYVLLDGRDPSQVVARWEVAP